MKSGRTLAKLAIPGVLLLTFGIGPTAATVYQANNDPNLYGYLYQGDVPNIGISACAPTSAINSFTYLQNQFPGVYGTKLAPNPPTTDDVLNIAGPDYMNTIAGVGSEGGTKTWNTIWGRYIYIESRDSLQTQYSCQIAMKDGRPIDGFSWPLNRPVPGFLQNTPDANGIAVPTWQFIYQNLAKGADLGIEIPGHALTLSSFSFDDKNNNGVIDQGEGKVSFVDPGNQNKTEVKCDIWTNTDPGYLNGHPYMLLGIYGRIELIQTIIAEYPSLQPVPDSVQTGNILVLTTNAPYGTLTLRGGVLCAVGQTIWNKDLIIADTGGIFDTASACTLTGNISGTGPLNKMGGGVLFLRGTNSSSGGMTLTEGTANIVQDANLGSPTAILSFNGGTLQAGAPLNLSRPVEVAGSLNQQSAIDTGGYASSLNGALSGTGVLSQKGQGSLTLNGDGSGFTGMYYLTNGALILANTVGSQVEVGPQGVLKGSGSIMGAVTNEGTINPGNSVGTLNIANNYHQEAFGRLEVEVASATSFDKLSLTGRSIAQLDGALRPVLLAGYRPPSSTIFSGIITAPGIDGVVNGIQGGFATIENNTPILTWRPLYSTNQVDLTLSRDYAKPSFSLTQNQHAVGAMFNGVANTTSGDLATVLNALDSLPTASAVGNAYQQISADKAGAPSTLAFAGADLQQRELSRRITDLRFDGENSVGGRLPGFLDISGSALSSQSGDGGSLDLGAFPGGKTGGGARSGLYLEPAAVIGSRASTAAQTGFDFTIAGFTAGADYRARDDLLVGLATGYSHTAADFDGSGGSVEAHTWPVTVYGAYLPKPFYAYGSLGYALNLFDIDRNVLIGGLFRRANGSPAGHLFDAYLEAGYDLKAGGAVFTPMASLSYAGLWVDGYTEMGAGALNLNVFPQDAESLQTGFGGRLCLPYNLDSFTLVPQIYATYQHEFFDAGGGIDARLAQGGPTFTFVSGRIGRDFGVIGADITLLTHKNLKFRIDYNAEVGRSDYTAHYVSGGMRWEF